MAGIPRSSLYSQCSTTRGASTNPATATTAFAEQSWRVRYGERLSIWKTIDLTPCTRHAGCTRMDSRLQIPLCKPWDADRLDLGRVAITPLPQWLCTDAARDLLKWAHRRAVNGYIPEDVLSLWGVAVEIKDSPGTSTI